MLDHRIEIDDLHAHRWAVSLTVPDPQETVTVSLPVWIPGSYLVREFARHLSGLVARQGRKACAVEQLDKHRWRIRCSGRGALTLSWKVYAFDASVRTAWLDTRRGFFNTGSLCLRVEGREDEPQRLSLGPLPKGWQVATSMPVTGAARARQWLAADYDELIDHPFELGPFWRGRFEACGVEHEFVVAGALPDFDGERLLADTRTICEAQIRFWHGEARPPFERYVFMLAAVDEGYGGLEHRASTALIANRRDLPRTGATGTNDGYVTLLGLISHEYFHTWNVKRLKPREFAPYDLDRENYTRLLWFFEGFTSYYDDLFLVRTGLIDEPRYLQLLARTVNQVTGTPGRFVQSVADASFDAWVKYYRPDENTPNATVSYYTKGSLVALALDLRLREGRGAARTLDAVMQGLWRRSGGGPIDLQDIAAELARVGGRPFDEEIAQWVDGTAELPLRELLAAQGVQWRHEAPALAQRLGVKLADGAGGPRVQQVLNGGAAERTGLAAGDELLALDGWRLRKVEDLGRLGAGTKPQVLLAARDGRVSTLVLPAAEVTGAVELSAGGDAAARRRRQAWLGRRG